MACLILDNEPVAFPTINRNKDDLSKIPATVVVQSQDERTISYALSKMKTSRLSNKSVSPSSVKLNLSTE
jgi:hypothetical protein